MQYTNILYFFPENESFMTQWQRIHIFDELERNGHRIEVFNPLHYESSEHANEDLIAYIGKSKTHFDLFMSCAGSNLLFKNTVESVKSYGLPTLLICFDNLTVKL